jgi:type IV fimbrial biogenesis protein FimT
MRGFTLLELVVSMSLACILLMIAVPSMQQLLLRRQLEGAASEMYDNLLVARSQAIEKNTNAFLSFTVNGTGWLYGIDETAACDPATAGACQVNGSSRIYRGTTWKSVTLAHDFSGNVLSFEPRRGIASATGTIRLMSQVGELDVTVSRLGYVSICSVSTPTLGGYGPC